MGDNQYTFDRFVRLLITVAVIVGLYFLTNRLSGVLLPFIVAWFLAYMLEPLVSFLQNKVRLKNRVLSIVAALVIVFVVIGGIIATLAIPVSNEVVRMVAIVNNYLSGMDANSILPDRWQDIVRGWINELDIKSLLANFDFESMAQKGAETIGSILGTSISLIGSLFVVFIVILYLIFILLDYETLSEGFISAIPLKYRHFVGGIISDLSTGMSKYFRGQAIIASCVGVLFAIGFAIMGLPLGIVIGLFIGLLNMVPYLQTLGIPICMILGLLQSADTGTSYWIILLEIAAVFIIVQSIQDLFLTPKIMGNTLGMKPAVMLLALSIWGSLLGVAGMIIALPLTTVMISTYKLYVLHEDNNQQADTSSSDITQSDNQTVPQEIIETKQD